MGTGRCWINVLSNLKQPVKLSSNQHKNIKDFYKNIEDFLCRLLRSDGCLSSIYLTVYYKTEKVGKARNYPMMLWCAERVLVAELVEE